MLIETPDLMLNKNTFNTGNGINRPLKEDVPSLSYGVEKIIKEYSLGSPGNKKIRSFVVKSFASLLRMHLLKDKYKEKEIPYHRKSNNYSISHRFDVLFIFNEVKL